MGTIFYLLTPPGVTVVSTEAAAAATARIYTGSILETGTESYEEQLLQLSLATIKLTDNYTTTRRRGHDPLRGDPWTAGGLGDYHLSVERTRRRRTTARTVASIPSSKPIEKKEKAKEKKIESTEGKRRRKR